MAARQIQPWIPCHPFILQIEGLQTRRLQTCQRVEVEGRIAKWTHHARWPCPALYLMTLPAPLRCSSFDPGATSNRIESYTYLEVEIRKEIAMATHKEHRPHKCPTRALCLNASAPCAGLIDGA